MQQSAFCSNDQNRTQILPRHFNSRVMAAHTQVRVTYCVRGRTQSQYYITRTNGSSMGGDSLVGMETRYGLEVRGSNTGEGEIFRTRPDRPWAHPASCTVRAGY